MNSLVRFSSSSKVGLEYGCYDFITSGNGRVYGVCCHKGGSSFELIPYEDIKPKQKALQNKFFLQLIQKKF